MSEVSNLSNTLYLSFFGGFTAEIDGSPIKFAYVKCQLLLAYLAVEQNPSRGFSRETLATLLWTDISSTSLVLGNLRQVLCNLRRKLGSFANLLKADRNSISFISSTSVRMDINFFLNPALTGQEHDLKDDLLSRMIEAAACYQGEFLAGFQLSDCEEFEQWVRIKREKFHRQALSLMQTLSCTYEHLGHLQSAIYYAQRLVDLEPLQDETQQRLIRLYAAAKQSSAALGQFESYRKQLWLEHGLEPGEEVLKLMRSIRNNESSGWILAAPILSAVTVADEAFALEPIHNEQNIVLMQEINDWIDLGDSAFASQDKQAGKHYLAALRLVMELEDSDQRDWLEASLADKIQTVCYEKQFW
jgi:DNA-binding SARP family transcriptional activator